MFTTTTMETTMQKKAMAQNTPPRRREFTDAQGRRVVERTDRDGNIVRNVLPAGGGSRMHPTSCRCASCTRINAEAEASVNAFMAQARAAAAEAAPDTFDTVNIMAGPAGSSVLDRR